MLLFEMIGIVCIVTFNERVVKLGAKAIVAVWGFYQELKEKKKGPHFDSTLIENEENSLSQSKWIVTSRKLISILIYSFCIVQLVEISNRSVWIDMASQATRNSIIWNELLALRLLNLELIVATISIIFVNGLLYILLYQVKREYLLFYPINKIVLFLIYLTVAVLLLATNIEQFCWMFL